jgi:tetratricopeptide (TPR) repeat protein
MPLALIRNIKLQEGTVMRGSFCWVISVTMLLISASAYTDSAEMLYQDGLYKEKTLGDPEAAIEVYKKALEEYTKSEEFAARAQLRIGICYDLLGNEEEALEAYMKIILDFPNQKEVRDEALQRLAAKGGEALGEAFARMVPAEALRSLQAEMALINSGREPIFREKVNSPEKQEALRKIEQFYNEAEFNQGAIIDIAHLVPRAEYNIPVFVHTAYLASRFGYHTGPLVDIAKLAALCDRDCEELYELAELDVMKKSDSVGLMRLARSAVKAESKEEKKKLRQGIDEFRATADYKSIEEALEREQRGIFGEKVDSPEKQEALLKIEQFNNEARFHHGAIVEIARLVPKAEYNIPVIVHCAYLASKFGYHTVPLMDIAQLAVLCDQECEELRDIAELAVLKLSGTAQVVQLAKSAFRAQGEEEKKQLRKKIEELKATADYKNIEEALLEQKKEDEREREEFEAAENIPLHEGIDPEPLKQMARDFFQALIDKDFGKASEIAAPAYRDSKWEKHYGDVVEIISIGEPFHKKGRWYLRGKRAYVPYEIKFGSGRVKKWQIAMRCDNPEGKWIFDGGL